MKTRVLKLFLASLMALVMVICFCVGCSKEQQNTVPPKSSEITLACDSVNLCVYESIFLSYSYDGEKSVEWSTSDNSVVGVENGKITAKKVGNATISVSDGEVSDTCSVVVSSVDYSRLTFTGVSEKEMYVGDSLNLNVGVQFDGENIALPEFNYQSTNADIVSVSNNSITANSVGKATINLTAEIGGITTGCAVNVNVIPTGKVVIGASKISFDAIDSYGLANTTFVDVKVYEKNVLQNNAEISFKSLNSQIFTVSSDGELTAVCSGSADLVVEYVGADGFKVSDIITVEVLKADIELNQTQTSKVFSNEITDLADLVPNQTLNIESAFVIDGNVKIPVYVSGEEMDFSEVNIYGEKQLVLVTAKANYILTVDLWTAKIATVDQFQILKTANRGKYLITADIDMTDKEWVAEKERIFSGVLDGGNFTIKGLTIDGNYGLFGCIGSGAEIKNIKFENAKISDVYGGGLLAGSLVSISTATVKIENFNADVSIYGTECGGLFGKSSGSKISLNNVFMHVYSPVIDGKSNGAVLSNGSASVEVKDFSCYSRLPAMGAGTLNVQIIKPEIFNVEIGDFSKLGYKEFDVGIAGDKNVTVYGATIQNYQTYQQTLQIPETCVNGYAEKQMEIFSKSANGEVLSYNAFNIKPVYRIYKRNIEDIRLLTTGTAYLMEDIDMKGYSWAAYPATYYQQYEFSGIFDGQGYAIKNFSTAANEYRSSLFCFVSSGTIKNLKLINATIQGNTAVLVSRAGKENGSCAKFENIYVSASSSAASSKQGIVVNINENSSFKNVLAISQGAFSNSAGILCGGLYSRNVTVENVYVVGAGTVINPGTQNGVVYSKDGKTLALENTDYFKFNSVEEFRLAYTNQSVVPEKFMVDAFNQSKFFILLNQQNFKDYIMTLKDSDGDSITTKTLLLETDINLSGVTWDYGSTHYNSLIFSGVLDGQGHTIRNFTTGSTARSGGLFLHLQGSTIKNLIMENVAISSSNNAVFAGRGGKSLGNNLYTSENFENVYVQITSSVTKGAGLIEASYGYNLKNVCVDMSNTTKGCFGAYTYSYDTTYDNAFFVGSQNVEYVRSGGTVTGTPMTYSTLSAFSTALATNGANVFIKNAYSKLYEKNN